MTHGVGLVVSFPPPGDPKELILFGYQLSDLVLVLQLTGLLSTGLHIIPFRALIDIPPVLSIDDATAYDGHADAPRFRG